MNTLEAPERVSRREVVGTMLEGLPGFVDELVVAFADCSFPTTSFMHELVHATLVLGKVGTLVVVSPDEFVHELAQTAAESFEVAARLTVRETSVAFPYDGSSS